MQPKSSSIVEIHQRPFHLPIHDTIFMKYEMSLVEEWNCLQWHPSLLLPVGLPYCEEAQGFLYLVIRHGLKKNVI